VETNGAGEDLLTVADAARYVTGAGQPRTPAAIRAAVVCGTLRIFATTRGGVKLFVVADLNECVARCERRFATQLATQQRKVTPPPAAA